MLKRLKHQVSIAALQLSDCPKKNAVEKEGEAFRFCFDTLEHPDTWITQAEKLERSASFPRENTSKERLCDSFGLSFFTTEKSANAVWKAFNTKMKEKMGYKNVSRGSLEKSDGLSSPVESNGHFNLFEFEECNLKNRFVIHSKL